jgi:hypothetical protein
VKYTIPARSKVEAIIVDLDGTLCDIEHRKHFIISESGELKDKPDWDGFNAECINDTPVAAISELMDLYSNAGFHILILTGRDQKYESETRQWLMDNDIPWAQICMRETGDYRSDFTIKHQHYIEQIAPHFDVRFVLEDRKAVVEMWRDLGLLCLQPAQGEY